jgi:putative endonuclease
VASVRNDGIEEFHPDYAEPESNTPEPTMAKQFYVYILASKRNGTLYTGVTSNLMQRVWQHKHDVFQGFTRKYNVKILAYYEVHENAESALLREKKIKKWRRAWKLGLIEENNPEWRDLYEDILG